MSYIYIYSPDILWIRRIIKIEHTDISFSWKTIQKWLLIDANVSSKFQNLISMCLEYRFNLVSYRNPIDAEISPLREHNASNAHRMPSHMSWLVIWTRGICRQAVWSCWNVSTIA